MKRLRYLPFIIACVLLLSCCNAAQSVPPWEADTANAQPAEASTAAGVHGTPPSGATASPAQSSRPGDYLPYQDLYDWYVKNGKTVPCDYKGKKLEVLVEITGTEDAVVSCPVVVGLDEIDITKPEDSKSNDLPDYEVALIKQVSSDTHMDQYNDDPEVRKALDEMAYDNRQLVKKEFGCQYDWQVWEDAGPNYRRIKKLPAELLASQQYDFQTPVDDNTAWALADAIVKQTVEREGVENSFLSEMRKTLFQWKSRWYEELYIRYDQLFDGIGANQSVTNGAVPTFNSDSPFFQTGSISFHNDGVFQQQFRLYKIIRRTASDDALITPEYAMELALQWADHGDGAKVQVKMEPTHIVYAYYPMNAEKGVDYKKGEWLMVPCCFVYFNQPDGDFGAVLQINALTGKMY